MMSLAEECQDKCQDIFPEISEIQLSKNEFNQLTLLAIFLEYSVKSEEIFKVANYQDIERFFRLTKRYQQGEFFKYIEEVEFKLRLFGICRCNLFVDSYTEAKDLYDRDTSYDSLKENKDFKSHMVNLISFIFMIGDIKNKIYTDLLGKRKQDEQYSEPKKKRRI